MTGWFDCAWTLESSRSERAMVCLSRREACIPLDRSRAGGSEMGCLSSFLQQKMVWLGCQVPGVWQMAGSAVCLLVDSIC